MDHEIVNFFFFMYLNTPFSLLSPLSEKPPVVLYRNELRSKIKHQYLS